MGEQLTNDPDASGERQQPGETSPRKPSPALADGLLWQGDDISPQRQAFDRAVTGFIYGLIRFFARHWLFIFNGLVTILVGLSFLAPYLESIGQRVPAMAIHFVYSYSCHQMPSRSFFLWGYKMPYCERDAAMYTAFLAVGLAFIFLRRRLRPLDWRLYALLCAPLVIDGTLQLIGLYESTWEARTFTGVLFGAASMWFIYPRMQIGAFDMLCNIDRIKAAGSGRAHPPRTRD
jgi:uncharacterized membrane protein